jgi:glycosyltransferase involved in cell wall biosynthesis
MRRVLFFLESLAGGGAEKVLTDIVGGLDKSKYDITVCTVTDGDVYQKKISANCHYKSMLKISNYHAGGIRKIFFWVGIKMIYTLPPRLIHKYFFREKYDIEVAFIEGFATKIIASSPDTSSKKIAWVHTDPLKNVYADKSFHSLSEQIQVYHAFDQILFVSDSIKTAFENKFFSDSRLKVQYNPIDEKTILQLSRESINIVHPEHGLLIGTIGRLEPAKGYLRLLKCVKELTDQGYSAFTIWILGKGSQQQILEQYIHDNHLNDIVKLLGYHSNPYKYLHLCDAFICSSYAEGFSTAATESLILGKPVFTVDCAGMRELLNDSGAGEVVPNTDKDLYSLLESLVSGQINLASYSKAAEKRGRDFNMEKRIQEIDHVLSSL